MAHRIFLNGGMFVDVVPLARRKAERIKAEQRAKDALAEIDSIGVQVKDIDIGLLDFPCEVEGQIILLCWKLGEKSITHWHGTQEGFAGRKPIDERIARGEEDQLARNSSVDWLGFLEHPNSLLRASRIREFPNFSFQIISGRATYSKVQCLHRRNVIRANRRLLRHNGVALRCSGRALHTELRGKGNEQE